MAMQHGFKNRCHSCHVSDVYHHENEIVVPVVTMTQSVCQIIRQRSSFCYDSRVNNVQDKHEGAAQN